VIEQGELPVIDGRFSYHFDPVAINKRIPIYDIENRRAGRPEVGRVVHLSFFAEEHPPEAPPYHDFARLILRGTRVTIAT